MIFFSNQGMKMHHGLIQIFKMFEALKFLTSFFMNNWLTSYNAVKKRAKF